MKTSRAIIIIIVLAIILCLLLYFVLTPHSSNFISSSEEEEIVVTEESSVLDVDYSNTDKTEEYSDYTAQINLDDLSINGDNVKIEDGKILITSDGTYYFTGTAEDSNIEIKADDNDKVILVFDNANITSNKTAVINGISADKIVVNLKEGSDNIFTDSSEYTELSSDDEPDSTIFSKTDLTINGKGSLTINANYKDGIASKDTLKIINSNITVNSNDDGIRGKDKVILKDVTLDITSKGDGIKSTNEEEDGKGFIYIDGGTIDINSEGDGINSATVLNINNDSEINIETTGDVADKTVKNEQNPFSTGKSSSEEDSVSSKALKAGTEITIESGKLNINSTDDAIHSNGFIIIDDVNAEISTGDDGIHSAQSLIIKNGTINIIKSYEALEAQYIEIDDGNIDMVASDDGINVNGGSDEFGGMGQSQTTNENRVLKIKGGTINVNADGDGLDSNGSVEVTGGTIIVAGATNGGNGALDYNGTFKITGGSLIYYGATGMWQDASDSSTLNTVSYEVSGNVGDELELQDENGNVIMSVTAEKNYGRISFVSSEIEVGKTYKLYVNSEEKVSLTTSSSGVTTNATNTGMQGGNRGGRMKQ